MLGGAGEEEPLIDIGGQGNWRQILRLLDMIAQRWSNMI